MEEGALLCTSCGAEVREVRPSPAAYREPAPPAELHAPVEVNPGPRCLAHPTMPVVGACPRCGKDVCIRCAPEAMNDDFTCPDCRLLTPAHVKAPAGATCAVHAGAPALFTCNRCGSFACASCTHALRAAPGLCLKCAEGTAHRLGTRGARFLANLLDQVVILVPLVIAPVLVGVFGRTAAGHENPYLGALLVVGMGGGLVVGAIVQLVAQLRWDQSVGKRLLKLKVVRVNGAPMELWRLLILRNLVLQALVQLCGLVGLLDALMIFGAEQRCLHDYLADSIVIDVSDQAPSSSDPERPA